MVAGVLPAAIGENSRDEGLICPAACGTEAAWTSPDIQIIAAKSLIQVANHFKGTQVLSRPSPKVHEPEATPLGLRARAVHVVVLLQTKSPRAGRPDLHRVDQRAVPVFAKKERRTNTRLAWTLAVARGWLMLHERNLCPLHPGGHRLVRFFHLETFLNIPG